jgi:isopentenyldiphosphate isomerase
MVRLEVQLVNESGRRIGYGDRWWTHRVKKGPDGPILGQKHVGICIACVDGGGRILVAHRRHGVFDKVWSLSGDTHPYRMRGSKETENIVQAAKRCAMEDLEVTIKGWTKRLTVSYSARDPRDPRYCENELMHVMVAEHDGPLHMNKKNAYDLRWVRPAEISKDSEEDLRKEPIDQKYAPWVHTVFALPLERIEEALAVN